MIIRNMFYYQVSMLQGIRNDSYERVYSLEEVVSEYE